MAGAGTVKLPSVLINFKAGWASGTLGPDELAARSPVSYDDSFLLLLSAALALGGLNPVAIFATAERAGQGASSYLVLMLQLPSVSFQVIKGACGQLEDLSLLSPGFAYPQQSQNKPCKKPPAKTRSSALRLRVPCHTSCTSIAREG